MKSEGPTSLETDLDVESDSVVDRRAASADSCSALRASKAPVVAGARVQPLYFRSEQVLAAAEIKGLDACGHQGRRS